MDNKFNLSIFESSIAYISAKDENGKYSVGTAFLVSPRRLLTAAHNVGDRNKSIAYGEPKLYEDINVVFDYGDPARKRKKGAIVVDGCFDPRADWALLELFETEEQRHYIPLGALEQLESRSCFITIGYPAIATQDALAAITLSGYIENANALYQNARAFQLYCAHAGAGLAKPLSGLSGAPCIVDGIAVGIMRANLLSNSKSKSIGLATLYACPLTTNSLLRQCEPYLGAIDSIPVTRRSLKYHIEATVDSASEIAATGILRPFHRDILPASMNHLYVRSQFRTHPTYGDIIAPNQDLQEPIRLEQFLDTPQDLFVIGEPGSGKSFAAANLAIALASSWYKDPSYLGPVPIRVLARHLWIKKSQGESGRSFMDVVQDAMLALTNDQGKVPADLWERTRQAHIRKIVIIDAVDEIIGDEEIERFLDWVLKASKNRSDISLVIFSRPLPFRPDSEARARLLPLLMLPLSHENKLKLLEHTLPLLRRSPNEAIKLIERVEKDSLVAFSENPAALMLLAVAWSESPGQSLPRQRSTLLAKFVSITAKEFGNREYDPLMDFADKQLRYEAQAVVTTLILKFESVLRLVAAATLEQPEFVELESNFVDWLFDEGILSQEIRQRTLPSRLAAVVKEFLLRSGLLILQGNVFRFGHNLVREFLIARHWILAAEKLPLNSRIPPEFWRWQDPRRREILAMAIPNWLHDGCFSDLRGVLYRIGYASPLGAAFVVDVFIEGADLDKSIVVDMLRGAMRKYNRCAGIFAVFQNPSPVPMIRRLISESGVLEAVINAIVMEWHYSCPLTSGDFVSVARELERSDLIFRMATESVSKEVRLAAIAALFESKDPRTVNLFRETLSVQDIRALLETNWLGYSHEMISLVKDPTCPPWVRLELYARIVSVNAEINIFSDIEQIVFGTVHTADYHNLPSKLISTLAPILSSHILKNSEHISPGIRVHIIEILLKERDNHCSITDQVRTDLARNAMSIMQDPLVDDRVVQDLAMLAKSVLNPQEFIRFALPIIENPQYSIKRKKECARHLFSLGERKSLLRFCKKNGINMLSFRERKPQFVSEDPINRKDVIANEPISEGQPPSINVVVNNSIEAELASLTDAIERFTHNPSISARDEMLHIELIIISHGREPSRGVNFALTSLGEASILAERVLNTDFPYSVRENALWGLKHILAIDQLMYVIDKIDPMDGLWESGFNILAPLIGLSELLEICSDGILNKGWPEERIIGYFRENIALAPSEDRDQLASLAFEKRKNIPNVLQALSFVEAMAVHDEIDSELALLLQANPSLINILLYSTRVQNLATGAAFLPVLCQSAITMLESLNLEQRLLVLANVLKASPPEKYEKVIKAFVSVGLPAHESDDTLKVALERSEQVISLVADSYVTAQINQLLSPILLPVTKSALKRYSFEQDIVRVSVKLFLYFDKADEFECLAMDMLKVNPSRLGVFLEAILQVPEKTETCQQFIRSFLLEIVPMLLDEHDQKLFKIFEPVLQILPDDILELLLDGTKRNGDLWKCFRQERDKFPKELKQRLSIIAHHTMQNCVISADCRIEAAYFLYHVRPENAELASVVKSIVNTNTVSSHRLSTIIELACDLGLAQSLGERLAEMVVAAGPRFLTPWILWLLPANIDDHWTDIVKLVETLNEPLRSRLSFLIETRRMEAAGAPAFSIALRYFRLCCVMPNQEIYRWACASALEDAEASESELSWIKQVAYDDYWYGVKNGGEWNKRAISRWASLVNLPAATIVGIS